MSEANVPAEHPQAGQEARLQAPDVNPGGQGDHQGQAAQGPRTTVGLIWRVDRRETFLALRKARRQRKWPITVSWVPCDRAEPPRVAYSIGRHAGSAVVRNLARRRLRVLIRENAALLWPGSYLVGLAPEGATMTAAELREALLPALARVAGGSVRR